VVASRLAAALTGNKRRPILTADEAKSGTRMNATMFIEKTSAHHKGADGRVPACVTIDAMDEPEGIRARTYLNRTSAIVA